MDDLALERWLKMVLREGLMTEEQARQALDSRTSDDLLAVLAALERSGVDTARLLELAFVVSPLETLRPQVQKQVLEALELKGPMQ